MKNTITLILAIICSFNLVAQDFGYAVNIWKNDKKEDLYFNKKLLSDIEKTGDKQFVIYDWNESGIKFNSMSTFKEKPVEYAIFVTPSIFHFDPNKPKIETTVDTSGYITNAWFSTYYKAEYYLKMINVKTGAVADIDVINHDVDKGQKARMSGKFSRIPINVKKYFGLRRSLKSLNKNPKRYNAIKRLLYKDYKVEISDRFISNREELLTRVKHVVSSLNSLLDDAIFDVTLKDKNADKITSFDINGGTDHNITKWNLLELYAPVETGGKMYVEHVTFAVPDIINEHTTTCKKTFIQSKKKFTKNLKKHDKIYALRKKSLAKTIVPTPESEIINLSLELNKAKDARVLEQRILYLPTIRLIERKLDRELNVLRNIYKDERFMDYNLGDLQDQQIGAKYILTFDGSNVSVTDIATSKVTTIDRNEGKRGWLSSGYSDVQAINMGLMKISGKTVEILKVLKEKKGKVKQIMVYHPFGFEDGDKMDISIIKEEKIGKKTILRKEYIANGYISHEKESPNIGIMYVRKKGRKALFQAMQNKEKFDFIYSIKRD